MGCIKPDVLTYLLRSNVFYFSEGAAWSSRRRELKFTKF